MMKIIFLALLGLAVCLGNVKSSAVPVPIEDCLKRDSIQCLQSYAFRQVKTFFDQDSIELFGGLSLVREPNNGEETGRAASDAEFENDIESKDAEKRENALESYTVHKVSNFFYDRTLKWNISPIVDKVTETARALVDDFSPELKEKMTQLVTEGRGRKKVLKRIMPILLAVGMKVKVLAVITFLGIALIAKKAILAALLSIAISSFIGLKKLLSHQHHHPVHHEIHDSHGYSGGGGFSSGGGGGGGFSGGFDSSYSGHGEYGSHSSPVAHSIAYSGQKPNRR